MTLSAFKDLKRFVDSQQQQQQIQQRNAFSVFRGKEFWIWDIEEHKAEHSKTGGFCCFNHVIGLPQKDGIQKPMFDYEKTLYDALLVEGSHNPLGQAFKERHLFVLKSTGLGVTEFYLRLMAYLAVRNDDYRNSQICVVTGPNQDISIKLIRE